MNNIKYLYHYTKLSTGLEYILSDMKLKMSSMKELSDPYENQKLYPRLYKSSNLKSKDYNIEGEFLFDTSYKINKKIREKSKILCFTLNDISKDKNIYNEGFFKPRMWDQYGEKHKGFCFEFDKNKLIDSFKNEKIKYYDIVNYSNKMNINDCMDFDIDDEFIKDINNDLLSFIENNNELLFFTKLLDWKDENEFRVICITDEGEKYIDITKSLSSIYLGSNFPKIYTEVVKKIIVEKEMDVKIKKINLENFCPNLKNIYPE